MDKGSLNNKTNTTTLVKKDANLGLFRPSNIECVAHEGYDPQIGIFAGNITNKQSRTTVNSWSSSLRVWPWADNSLQKEFSALQNDTQGLVLGRTIPEGLAIP